MKLNDINYAPLRKMNSAFDTTVREIFKAEPALVIVGLIAVGLMLSILLRTLIIFILLVAGFSAYVGKKTHEYKEGVWKAFAAVNGWAITPGAVAPLAYVPPSLLHTGGRSRKLGDIVHADIDGHACSVYMFQFTTGRGKSQKTHYYTVARVEVARPFPHIILDSKSSWALNNRGTATSTVKLEGDFNKYFSLYFDKGEHIDAMSIITPDIMQTLISSNQAQDIEIIDQNIYFMASSDQRNDKVLPGLFASVDSLADELSHKAKTINYKTGRAPNQAALQQIAVEYFKSGERVGNTVAWIIVAIVMVPMILIAIMGFALDIIGQ